MGGVLRVCKYRTTKIDRLLTNSSRKNDIDKLHPTLVNLGPIDEDIGRGVNSQSNTVAFDGNDLDAYGLVND